jgi:hypothetical protein
MTDEALSKVETALNFLRDGRKRLTTAAPSLVDTSLHHAG